MTIMQSHMQAVQQMHTLKVVTMRLKPKSYSLIEGNRSIVYYTTMHSPIARSVVLRRYHAIIDLLGNVFIHNAARSRLSANVGTVQRANRSRCSLSPRVLEHFVIDHCAMNTGDIE